VWSYSHQRGRHKRAIKNSSAKFHYITFPPRYGSALRLWSYTCHERSPERFTTILLRDRAVIYAPRIIADHIMVQEDFERLHKFLLETECLSEVSDDMREVLAGA
jgi:hypothetical protein